MKKNRMLGLALLSVSVAVTLTAVEKTAADRFIAFNTMEKGHKADWFDYMKKVHDNKYDLLKKTHADWTDYQNQNSQEWQKSTDFSPAKKDTIFTGQLNRAVALHRKHMNQFKKMCDDQQKEAVKIQARHEKELNAFMGMPAAQVKATK
ncbi:MAG TPA: hypothetical protein VHA52_12970 [Candidatus Babeliaceae bacterium]|nr:hypothetical protein [Candidatus Babeliaceae bacterium]